MVDFAGWDMPVQYAGPMQEHIAVRTRAGIFDVSHMGEIELKGSSAEETIQKVTSNDVRRLAIGQCHYSALTTPKGTFVDDILVYRMGRGHFFLCVNSSNQEKDFEWIRDHAEPGTEVLFRSEEFSQLAIQGPRSVGDPSAVNRHQPCGDEVLLVCGGEVRGNRRDRVAHRLHRRGRVRDLPQPRESPWGLDPDHGSGRAVTGFSLRGSQRATR